MTLFAAPFCNAQDAPQTITEAPRVVERLADGSLVVTVDGVEFRAFPPAMMRDLLKAKALRESLEKEVAALKEQVVLLEQIKATSDKIEANQAEEIAMLNKQLTATTNQLFKAMDLNAELQLLAKTGKFVALLNSPVVKILMTLASIAADVLVK